MLMDKHQFINRVALSSGVTPCAKLKIKVEAVRVELT